MPEEFQPNELSRLMQSGVLGQFPSLEVTTITLTQAAPAQTFNLLTVIVAQDRTGVHTRAPRFLGDRISVPGLAGLSFGIAQHELAPSELTPELEAAIVTKQWGSGSNILRFGDLAFRGRWFVPADGAGDPIAVNQVLKNNFWNGSHVWEWTDMDKTPFRSLLQEPRHLQFLSEAISARLPIRIASVSDKLGGLILQLPVQVLHANLQGRGSRGGAETELQWLPGVTRRPVVISLDRSYDGLYADAVVTSPQTAQVELVLPDSPGLQFATIRDAETGDVLGRYSLAFLRVLVGNVGAQLSEQRIFTIPGSTGSTQHQIAISSTQVSHVGDTQSLKHFADTNNRIYRAEMQQLRERLELVQYMPDPRKSKAVRHEEALRDLRRLIEKYGRNEVCLWDPFLSAEDVLETLFFNPHSESQMRAISGANEVDDPASAATTVGSTAAQRFVIDEHNAMVQHAGNAEGLQLEFRARSDSAGWPFHDRFIIFPQSEGQTLAWSLGTSVNSFGEQHHILQKVPDGRLIADAFDTLWSQLNQPQHLIWRTP